MGREMTPPAEELHHRLRRRTDDAQLRVAQVVHVGAGIDLAQRPVQVERVGAEVDLEPLGQDHLEDVARQDVLLGHLHRLGVQLGRGAPAHVGQLVVAFRRGQERLVEGPGASRGQLVEPGHRRVVESVAGRHVARRLGRDRHRLDEGHPLAPVVVGRHLAHDREDGVGIAGFVRRGGRQMFDLADDVVPEIPDDAAVQRWQLVDLRRPVGTEYGLDGRQDAAVEGDAGRQFALHRDGAVGGDQSGRRLTAHKRPPAPPLGMLDRLQEESPVGMVGAGQPGEGRHRRGQIGEELPPHRDHRVLAGQRGELVAARVVHRPARVMRRRRPRR